MLAQLKRTTALLTIAYTLYAPTISYSAVYYDADSSNTTLGYMGLSTSYLGASILANPSQLTTGSNQYKYAVILFKPDVSGTYVFGQTYAPVDTVMILYDKIFDALVPGGGALVGNDDTPMAKHQAIVGSGITTFCGSAGYCPQVSITVEAGKIYSLVVSVYRPAYALDIPFQFYSSGTGSFASMDDVGPIDLRKAFYASNTLGFTTYPIFKGGTLKIDVSNQTYTEDFTLSDISTNAIDQAGNHVIFAGVFSDEVATNPGGITIKNSGNGGSVTFSGANTYTGWTTIAPNSTLRLEGAGTIAQSRQVTLGGTGATLDISTIQSTEATINNLSGAAGSQIKLQGKTLAINSEYDATYRGDFDASSGSLRKIGVGNLTLAGNTHYRGNTLLDAGSLTLDGQYNGARLASDVIGQANTQLSLINGAQLTGAIQTANVTIDAYSSWNLTQNSSLGDLSHSGSVIFSPPSTSGYKILAIQGNYHGNNGSIALNTYLGNDLSPSDKIMITGNTTGTTRLFINNTGGPGEAMQDRGIQLVESLRPSSPNAFISGNDVYAGAYEYQLNRNNNDWYLTSNIIPSLGNNGGIDLYGALPFWIMAANGANSDDNSIYRADAGIDLANRESVIEMMVPGFSGMGAAPNGISGSGAMRAHLRLGASQSVNAQSTDAQSNASNSAMGQKSNSIWSFATVNNNRGKAANGQLRYSGKSYGLQIGGDHAVAIGDGLLQLGVMTYMNTTKTHSRNLITGSIARGDSDGYGFGLYSTWYFRANDVLSPFIDVYALYGRYKNTVKTRNNSDYSYRSNAYSFTLQGGYPISLGKHLILEPQAQITYVNYAGQKHKDHVGTEVKMHTKGNIIGRVGTYVYAPTYRLQPYAAVNVWYDDTRSEMRYNARGGKVKADKRGTIFEAKVGLQTNPTPNLTFWAELSARSGQNSYRDVGGALGIKYIW